jgi:hypothetical protein
LRKCPPVAFSYRRLNEKSNDINKTVLFISNLCAKVPALIIQGFVELLSDGPFSLQLITCSYSLTLSAQHPFKIHHAWSFYNLMGIAEY